MTSLQLGFVQLSALACTLVTATAQKVSLNGNPTMIPNSTVTAAADSWALVDYLFPAVMPGCSAIEVLLEADAHDVPTQLGIWSVDAVTGEPGVLLASGIATVGREPTLYSARLTNTVSLTFPNRYYFGGKIGPQPNGTVSMPTSTTAYAGACWVGTPGNWQSAGTLALRWNLYRGVHSGSVMSYGTGTAGPGGLGPELSLQGFPNITNTVRVQIGNAAPGAIAVIVVGDPLVAGATTPLGTLYVLPVTTSIVSITSATAPAWTSLSLDIPNDPQLAGATLGFEGWILDSASATGFSHSDALQFSVGN